MPFKPSLPLSLALVALIALSACGQNSPLRLTTPGKKLSRTEAREIMERATLNQAELRERRQAGAGLFGLFRGGDDPSVTVAVNRYLWNASLDVLNFLPIEAADPFSGVIVMGWGKAPGSGRSYRATVYITDPALEARSLKVALMTRAGPADRDTVTAIEDAILTRARQLRIADTRK